jgi:holo-[acyl-carrier protein] synthase
MTLYTGIDIIELDRFADALGRWGERFLRRVFTPAERARYAGRTASLAARWAAKEAAAKLLGVGVRGLGGAARSAEAVSWQEIEVLSDQRGRPIVTLSGSAAARATALGIGPIAISLSHTRQHAVASLVALVPDNTSALPMA